MIPRLFIPVVCICLPLFLNGCASSGKSDAKDYTVALGTAYPNEAHIAQERVRQIPGASEAGQKGADHAK